MEKLTSWEQNIWRDRHARNTGAFEQSAILVETQYGLQSPRSFTSIRNNLTNWFLINLHFPFIAKTVEPSKCDSSGSQCANRALPRGGKVGPTRFPATSLSPPYKSAASCSMTGEPRRDFSCRFQISPTRITRLYTTMAEVVGSISAITSLVTLALQSSITLYQTVQSLQSRDKVIRKLRQEVEALQAVLQALAESICSFEVDLTALTQPLMRCNNACNEFNTLIMKCTPHSTGEWSSKRDETGLGWNTWARTLPVSRTCWLVTSQPFPSHSHMQICKLPSSFSSLV